MKPKELELRSTIVQEILGYIPHWMIRWGITLFAILLVMGLFIAWLIKYPDVLAGKGRLTSAVPPIVLQTTQPGTISRLYVSDNVIVDAHAPLAEIQSGLSGSAIAYLKKWIPLVEQELAKHCFSIQQHDPIHTYTGTLGPAQEAYNHIQTEIHRHISTFQNDHHQTQYQYITEKMAHTKSLLAITKKQLTYTQRIVMQEKAKFHAKQKLYQKKMLSQVDFFEQEASLLRKLEQVANIEKDIVGHQMTLGEQQKTLKELQFTHRQNRTLLESTIRGILQSLQKEVALWKQNYQLVAPFAGRICHLDRWITDQQVSSGQALFAVVPTDEHYIVELHLPSTGYGKITKGQLARIQLPAYPEQEYGYLQGIVASMALVPHADTYRVTLTLSKGLTTNYDKKITFKPNMECTAEIITEDMRLLTRMFYKLLRLKND